jgi:hypothetical protein
MRPGRRRALLGIVLWGLLRPIAVQADSSDTVRLDTSRCESDTQARLEWLVERLESRERYADLWWRGWTGIYATGMVLQGVRAGLEDDDEGERADYIVSAVKAAGGVTRLYFSRPVARLGADPLRGDVLADEAACRAAADRGEALLGQAAHESDRRWRLIPHLTNVAINMAGALIVTQGFDEDDGWASAAVGIAVGEAMLWTHPWRGRRDLQEYEKRFAAEQSRVSWAVAPYGRGLSLQIRF